MRQTGARQRGPEPLRRAAVAGRLRRDPAAAGHRFPDRSAVGQGVRAAPPPRDRAREGAKPRRRRDASARRDGGRGAGHRRDASRFAPWRGGGRRRRTWGARRRRPGRPGRRRRPRALDARGTRKRPRARSKRDVAGRGGRACRPGVPLRAGGTHLGHRVGRCPSTRARRLRASARPPAGGLRRRRARGRADRRTVLDRSRPSPAAHRNFRRRRTPPRGADARKCARPCPISTTPPRPSRRRPLATSSRRSAEGNQTVSLGSLPPRSNVEASASC
jgi:hypothetical protein